MAQHMKPPLTGSDHYGEAMKPDREAESVARDARDLRTPAPKMTRSTLGTVTGESRNSPLTGSKPRSTGRER